MLFLLMCLDDPDKHATREALHAEHRTYVKENAPQLVTAGPLTSDDGERMTGSFMIFDVDDRTTVESFHEGDPFRRAGLFHQVTISRWDKHIPNADPFYAESDNS